MALPHCRTRWNNRRRCMWLSEQNRSSAISLYSGVIVIITALVVSVGPAQARTLTVLHNFTNGGDGGSPSAGLTMDHAGNFYGTAMSGGEGNSGTVFKLSRAGSGWVLTT